MVGENGWEKWGTLVLSKLDEHSAEMKETRQDLAEIRETLAVNGMNEQNHSKMLGDRVSRVERAVTDVTSRVQSTEIQIDRVKVGTGAVKTAVVATASIVGTLAAAWAWVESHLSISRLK